MGNYNSQNTRAVQTSTRPLHQILSLRSKRFRAV